MGTIQSTLAKFLEEKSLYYDKIDYDVIHQSWEILSKTIVLPYVIHIVGTNGKGSTGRYLASLLQHAGKKVLHYSSPHILQFNERIWIDGKDSSDTLLEETHRNLLNILPDNLLAKLTYFEYTTLLAFYLSQNKDYLVLEAGLGGEFDATNVVENDLSVFTTIGLDHQSFLGNSVEEIATTKMKSCNNSFILSDQVFEEVGNVQKVILKDKKQVFQKKFELSFEAKKLPLYLQNNLQVALSILSYLKIEVFNYTLPQLFGRFQKITSNIIIDVGHNPLAAKAIAKELSQEKKKYILVYNSFKDKDYEEVLKILKPFILEVQIMKCQDTRMVKKETLEKAIQKLSIKSSDFKAKEIESSKNYLIFGSFLVVENFLKVKYSDEKK